MNIPKRIGALFLLCMYALSISAAIPTFNKSQSPISHKHDEYSDVHHVHFFHVGILHLLGHLVETISQLDDNADELLLAFKEKQSPFKAKKIITYSQLWACFDLLPNEVDLSSLSGPPITEDKPIAVLLKSSRSLRGPPSFV